jgi:hypothetical protein
VALGGRVLAPCCVAYREKCYPAAVPHGGRDLTPWGAAVGTCHRGVWRQMYISRKFCFDYLFFENQSKINIKKFVIVGYRQRRWVSIVGKLQCDLNPLKKHFHN